MALNKKIIRLLAPHQVDYIGFADIRPYEDELARQGGSIVAGYGSAVSIGMAIPDSIADFLPQRDDVNVSCQYRTHGYDVLNERLNMAASVLSSWLNRSGHRTLPIAVANRTDMENAVPTVSHKTVAHIAGLGWIGKNCLLVTEDHGPRVRFISVLTRAPLRTVNNPLEQRCGDCRECVTACPVKAIKGRNYVAGEAREERLDFIKCHNYFEGLKKSRAYPVCGLCLHACPYGKH
ncbi:MAG: epoxyqueuosine reductase [Spirochaetes bacterium]|nr:epoxyqueuosine reductase [Spirochaetota bacterium]